MDCMDHDAYQTRYVLWRMQHAPTYTDQKIDSTLDDESQTRYVLGRMQYAPTHTVQISNKCVFIGSYSRKGLNCPCRGVLHTPYECP